MIKNYGGQFSKIVQKQCVEVVQVARVYDFRQRASVYNRIDEEVEQNVGNRNKTINSFSSTDRQINREDKSRVGTVSKDVH